MTAPLVPATFWHDWNEHIETLKMGQNYGKKTPIKTSLKLWRKTLETLKMKETDLYTPCNFSSNQEHIEIKIDRGAFGGGGGA